MNFYERLELKRLSHYLSISILATFVDFSIFILFINIIGLHYLISNLFSRILGILTKFSLNKFYTFKDRNENSSKNQFKRFLIVSGSGFIVSLVFLFIAVELIGLPKLYAKLFEIGIVFTYTFILHNKYSFN